MELLIKKITEDAVVPQQALEGDAAFDLYVAQGAIIRHGERVQVRTGIAMSIPEGYAGLIWDKSGLSHKNGLKVMGGVIDSNYTGEIMVGMTNLGKLPHRFSRGDKVAQILIQKVEVPQVVEVDELPETNRGDAGFGSTGK